MAGTFRVKILCAVQDPELGPRVECILSADGHSVRWASNEEQAHTFLAQEIFDAFYIDMDSIGGSRRLLEYAKSVNSFGIVILLSSHEKMIETLEAMEAGADAYVKKPFEAGELLIGLNRLLDHRSLLGANFYLRRTQDIIYRFDDIIGESKGLKKVLSIVQKVAKSNASILIVGETGTGKELIAGAIHYNSDRKERNFIKVNCAALQDTLLESELFGHEKGAFTGADKQRIGRFEQANFGTIFLDEIADMSPSTQAKVLRVLQEHEFERVGGTKPIKVDVRILSATNKDLRKEIEEKRFRDDLYYRLNVVTIHVPPLRERKDDILPLAHYFLRRFCGELSKKVAGFTPEAERKLLGYSWPGNIRELRNTIERAVLLTEKASIQEEDIVLAWTEPGEQGGDSAVCDRARIGERRDEGELIPLEEMERRLVLEALEKANWVQKEAASYLGISRRVMHYKIHKFGLHNERWRKKT